jgi:hypothetical protein
VYDLSVTVTDTRFDAELVATDTVDDALSYTSGNQTQIATAQILDRSGSMDEIMPQAKESARIFVELSSDEDYVSIVSYAADSRIDRSLVQLAGGRSAVLQTVSALSPDGNTNIGDALQDGKAQLNNAPPGTKRATILLTDGKHNTGPSKDWILDEVVPQYNSNDYCLYTIGFTDDADAQFLRAIAEKTDCGFYRSAGTEASETELRAVYEDMLDDVSKDSLLQRDRGTLESGETVNHTVRIDETVSQATVNVRLNGTELTTGGSATTGTAPGVGAVAGSPDDTVPVQLYTPTGTPVDLDADNVQRSLVRDTVIYRITDPAPGQWRYEITNPESRAVEYSGELVGDARARLDVATTADIYYTGSTAQLRAALVGPGGGISGADIRANVTMPDGNQTTVSLREQSSGFYVGSAVSDDAGNYTAVITARGNNLSRTTTAHWTVTEAPTLSLQRADPARIAQGTDGAVSVTLDRPVNATGSLRLQLSASAFVAANGSTTLSPTAIEPAETTVLSGDSTTVDVRVSVPDDATLGQYEGTLRVLTSDGGVIDRPVTLSVQDPPPQQNGDQQSSGRADDSDQSSGGGFPAAMLGGVVLLITFAAAAVWWNR